MRQLSQKHIYLAILLGFVLVLTGCGSLSKFNPFGTTQVEEQSLTAEQYLDLASSSPSPQRENYLLLAANRYASDNNTRLANNTLKRLDPGSLPSDQYTLYQVVKANIALSQNKPQSVITTLAAIQGIDTAPITTKRAYHEIYSRAYMQKGDVIGSINQRIALDPLLQDSNQRTQNQVSIWNNLTSLSLIQLESLMSLPQSQEVTGWLQLAYIDQQYRNNPDEFITQLQLWQHDYPQHSANQLLPSSFKNLPYPEKVDTIALLLPLSGKYAKSGRAIRDGYLAAYYRAKQQDSNVPSVRVINTASGKSIAQIYREAIEEGADRIVGPLTKDDVADIQAGEIQVPTIALNSTTNTNRDLYEFTLSPQDEAILVANRAWMAGYNRALMISPQGTWGDNLANAFSERWSQLGGQVVGWMTYGDNQDLSESVATLLNINDSQERKKELQTLLRQNIKAIPQRRQDVDVIFIASNPPVARQIKPLLKFYYAGDIPVYATSSIFTGQVSPVQDSDLDGIIFPDMPWVLSNKSSIQRERNRAKNNSPNSKGAYGKLYATGIDAYTVSTQLNRLILLPEFGISGATGILTLDSNHKVGRQLLWAQFENGKPVLIGPSIGMN